ncbi:MAG: HAMP domain-containing histidine kinase [Lachnospiraceae bacterium]|nr:HAMP domain-containing histidine kinase [Lachnospiraceae bacterium]
MKKKSIRAKITLWFSAALILVVVLTYFFILSVSRGILQKTIRDSLITTVESNVDEVEYYTSLYSDMAGNDIDYYMRYGNGYIEIDDDFLDAVNDVYTSLCQADGTLIYGENPIVLATSELGFQDSAVQRIRVNGTLYYVFDRQLTLDGLEGLWLRGVVSEEQGETELSAISRTSLILQPILVLIAVLGGWLIAGRVLAPIRQISETAAQIRQGDDLKKRIELSDGNDELHQLADQFNEMFSRLDDSFQAQQQFVSDASHELRTPVTVIRAQCDLTLEEEEASPEEYRESLEVIRRQSKKLSRLISDMLDFARLELQPERYQKEELDFSALVEDVCSDMALIRENNITLTCEAEPNIRIRGNRELLTRLLTNLISNAYRYGRSDGHIQVTLRSDPGHSFVLSVQDDGIGIAPEEQPNIFRRFYQADPSRSGKGNGLGLAMVKEIAEFHGGEIRVQSEPGAGSTFKFSLF